MTVRQIFEKLKSNEITLDWHGHRFWRDIKDILIKGYHRHIDLSLGSNDDKWSDSSPDVNQQMRKFYLDILDRERNNGVIRFDYKSPCFACGSECFWQLVDNKLIANHGWDRINNKYDIYPQSRCCMEGVKEYKVKIKTSGRLVFANYFEKDNDYLFPDAPASKEYSNEFSLNHSLGRKNIAEYKAATHNVAYGQTGNCGLYVYVSKDKQSILIDRRFSSHPAPKGYKFCGEIDCEVWRFEATDSHNLPSVPENSIIVDVEPGEYIFTHAVDWNEDNKSTLKLCKIPLMNKTKLKLITQKN